MGIFRRRHQIEPWSAPDALESFYRIEGAARLGDQVRPWSQMKRRGATPGHFSHAPLLAPPLVGGLRQLSLFRHGKVALRLPDQKEAEGDAPGPPKAKTKAIAVPCAIDSADKLLISSPASMSKGTQLARPPKASAGRRGSPVCCSLAVARLRMGRDTGPRITDDMLSLSRLSRIDVAEVRPEPLRQLAPAGATCRPVRSCAKRTNRSNWPCP